MLYNIGKLSYVAMFIVLACGLPQGYWDGYDQARLSKQPRSALSEAAAPTTTDLGVTPSVSSGKTPYAYVFHATQDIHACSVMINIQRLQDVFHSRHRIFVLLSHDVTPDYITLFKQRDVIASVETSPRLIENVSWHHKDCLLKILAFRLHHMDPTLKKVIVLGSDQLVLQNLDHIFLSSTHSALAAPRAYSIAKEAINSNFLLIRLSDQLWHAVEEATSSCFPEDNIAESINRVFEDRVMILPEQIIALISHWEHWTVPGLVHALNVSSDVAQSMNSTNEAVEANRSSLTSDAHGTKAVDLESIYNADAKSTRSTATEPELEVSQTHEEHSLDQIVLPGHEKTYSTTQEEQIKASSGDIFDYLEPLNVSANDNEEGFSMLSS